MILGGLRLPSGNNIVTEPRPMKIQGESRDLVITAADPGSLDPQYDDISSIESWNKYGKRAGATYDQVRTEIYALMDASGGYASLNDSEKAVIDIWNENIKLYRYVTPEFLKTHEDLTIPPIDHPFDKGLTVSLFRKDVRDLAGKKTSKQWFADEALTDKVIEEDMVYVMDAFGEPIRKTKTIKWFCEDDTAHPTTKVKERVDWIASTKMSWPQDNRKYIQRAMEDVARKMIAIIFIGGGQTALEAEAAGEQFLTDHDDAFRRFMDRGVTADVIAAINGAAETWFDAALDSAALASFGVDHTQDGPDLVVHQYPEADITFAGQTTLTIRQYAVRVYQEYDTAVGN